MSVVIITGLSGSGKTTALRALEDIGFLCMDNLPAVFVPKVVELASGEEARNIAVGIDVRDRDFIEDAGAVVDQMLATGVDLTVVYLGCEPQAIIRRFSETRRRHPLAETGDFVDAIAEEEVLLSELRHRAGITIDTSSMTVHELKRYIQQHFETSDAPRMTIKVMSFGFKHGPLMQADLVFDVRFLPNPYFIEGLRGRSGLSDEVSSFFDGQPDVGAFVAKIEDLLAFLIPRYEAEGKAYLTVGMGCTGGQHRSVALAERVSVAMAHHGYALHIEHRDRRHWKLLP